MTDSITPSENPPPVEAQSLLAEAPPLLTESQIDTRIDIDYFAKVELRVARVVAAEAVPKSKKLLKLQVDLGPTLGQRQLVAGVALHYPPETLIGKRIVMIANLKPASLMGIESQGMLLAASSPDNARLILVNPGDDMPEGSIVR